MRPEDAAVHRWYRFVLSFPPHLVQNYLSRFGVEIGDMVLDPFAGTGTTLIEAKKAGINSLGIESNPMAHFASSVKANWQTDTENLRVFAAKVADEASGEEARIPLGVDGELPLFVNGKSIARMLRQLNPEASKLLLKDSISPLPLHRSLGLLACIDSLGTAEEARFGRLALASGLVESIGNLKFGPEVGIGRIRHDAPVIETWMQKMEEISRDIEYVQGTTPALSDTHLGDARTIDKLTKPNSVDAVITSPPYPNEKDYTRTTRLESVLLGFVRSRTELRRQKGNFIRSNTRGVYKGDNDDQAIAQVPEVQRISDEIEQRRLDLGKTSGFERMYARVTRLYFGGMARHLAALSFVLKPGAQLVYIVGDQASYLRVKIQTGRLLAEIADSLGYEVIDRELFRTRLATVTGEQLREEALVLRWPGRTPVVM